MIGDELPKHDQGAPIFNDIDWEKLLSARKVARKMFLCSKRVIVGTL